MDLVVTIKDNTAQDEVIKLFNYLKSLNYVKKFDLRIPKTGKIKVISDKETVSSIHATTSSALTSFLENEKDSIF